MINEEFDYIINQKLHQYEAPVSVELWNKIDISLSASSPDLSFDDFIKDKLVNLIVPIPAGLWEKVKPEEEKRRRIFFFLPRISMIAASLLLLVLAGSVSAYLYYQKVHAGEISTLNGAGNSSSTAGIVKWQKKSDQITPNAADEKFVLSKNEKSAAGTAINTNTKNSTAAILNSSNGIIKSSKIIPAKLKINRSENNFSLVSNPTTIDVTTNNFTQTDISTEADIAISESYSIATKVGSAFIAKKRNLYNAALEKSISYFNESGKLKNIIICPSDRKSRNTDWDLEIYLGPNYATKSIISNTATSQFLSRKDSSETPGIGYSAGFRIVKPINDHFSIKTGFNFSQINEKFSYRTENEIKTTTIITQRIIIRAPGDTITISDTSSLQQIGFKNNNVKNRYRSIDIPILFGYQFGNDDLRVGINAGVMINLTSWYQGMIFDSSFAPQTIGKTADMVYKKNIGIGLYAGLSFMKRLNYNTHIFAEPYFRYNLSDMTMPGSAYKQRFSIGGLSLGLRFNLNQR
ncbi:MAG: PorT family protein [Sphingobacteriia bacterium]|nr:MAG: PorT family protein [Sphingobacteriia bacterium]